MGVNRADPSRPARGTSGRALVATWTGVVGPPLVFLAHLQIAYILVPLACDLRTSLVTHAAMLAAISLSAGAGWLALRTLRRHGSEWPDSSASVESRDRFLGVIGGLLAALVVLALLAQWIPTFFISPCRVG